MTVYVVITSSNILVPVSYRCRIGVVAPLLLTHKSLPDCHPQLAGSKCAIKKRYDWK